LAIDFSHVTELLAYELIAFKIVMGRHELAETLALLPIGCERAEHDGIEDGLFCEAGDAENGFGHAGPSLRGAQLSSVFDLGACLSRDC